jgi:hypothetical protein
MKAISERDESDIQYWENLAKDTGYTLYGYSGRKHASFHTPDGQVIQLDHEQVKFINKLLEVQKNYNTIDEDNDYGKYIDSRHGR